MASIQSIVNPGYDLGSDSLVDTCRSQLAQRAICILPNFLTQPVISDLLEFVDRALPDTPRQGLSKSTVYYQEGDEGYDQRHPKRRLVTRSNTYICSDQIPSDVALRKLHDDKVFRDFLCKVTCEHIVDYCHISKCCFSVSHEGDHQDWHFDNNFLTLTFMLRTPEAGGLLEVCPKIGRHNFEAVAEVLDKDCYSSLSGDPTAVPTEAYGKDTSSFLPKTQSFEYKVGDMILFYGRESLHRSTVVAGSTARVIAILGFSTNEINPLPNATHLEKVYGRGEKKDADDVGKVESD